MWAVAISERSSAPINIGDSTFSHLQIRLLIGNLPIKYVEWLWSTCRAYRRFSFVRDARTVLNTKQTSCGAQMRIVSIQVPRFQW
jgi:hypothetical protein